MLLKRHEKSQFYSISSAIEYELCRRPLITDLNQTLASPIIPSIQQSCAKPQLSIELKSCEIFMFVSHQEDAKQRCESQVWL